jgi:uncharacterized protein
MIRNPISRDGTQRTARKWRLLRYLAGSLAAVVVVAGAAIIAIARYLVHRVTTPRRSRRPPAYTFTPWEFQISYRTARIPLDGEELDAWFLPQRDPAAPVILMLSGFGGNKSELLGIASALHRDGFASLLFDYRGTGRSSGDIITLGHHETDDARAVLDWLSDELPNAPAGALGYSMGGSVAINLAATDDRIQAVAADSAFATQYGVLAHHVRRATRLRPEPVLAAAAPMFRWKHRRKYADFAPVDLVHMISPRPILLIHPENDAMVPMTEAMLLWNSAREPKQFWLVEGAGHCGAYFEDRTSYCTRISGFFCQALDPAKCEVSAGS